MSKQTATEWLYDNLKSHFEHDGDLFEAVQYSFNQAKEMEKKQIIDAYKEFLDTTLSDEVYEEYYNETFKNK